MSKHLALCVDGDEYMVVKTNIPVYPLSAEPRRIPAGFWEQFKKFLADTVGPFVFPDEPNAYSYKVSLENNILIIKANDKIDTYDYNE